MFCHCCCNIITFWMFCSHDKPSILEIRTYLEWGEGEEGG